MPGGYGFTRLAPEDSRGICQYSQSRIHITDLIVTYFAGTSRSAHGTKAAAAVYHSFSEATTAFV